MTIGSCFDILVIYFSPRMKNLYGDDDVEDNAVELTEHKKTQEPFIKSSGAASNVKGREK